MSGLSPEARKVFEAFNSKFEWIEDGVPGPQFKAIAAVIRTAALEVHSEEHETCGGASYSLMIDLDDLLILADELEDEMSEFAFAPSELSGPSDEELAELYRKSYYECENRQGDAAQVFALRAVLARWGK